MTPSFPLTQGLSVPIWPVPVAFPALPECALDEIVALADKYITDCYSGFNSPNKLIPPYLINGELCPISLDQHIDVVNCEDVGVSDGIQNLLYLGFWTLGSGFCDIAIRFANTCFGQWWPGLLPYLETTLDGFKMASDAQMDRQTWCFWATLPSIAYPLIFLFFIFTLLGVMVPALVSFLVSGFYLFRATPFYTAIVGGGEVGGGEGIYLDGSSPPPPSAPPLEDLERSESFQAAGQVIIGDDISDRELEHLALLIERKRRAIRARKRQQNVQRWRQPSTIGSYVQSWMRTLLFRKEKRE